MTNFSRWLLLIPVLIAAAAVPVVFAMRDPLHGARNQLASMTPAQRKEIERNRDAYDRLTSPQQHELRQFNEELLKLPPHERAELEALMGRLQAWVETFPDDVRAKYDAGLTSERIAILKSQLGNWKEEERKIAGQVRKAEEESRKAIVGVSPERREMQLKSKVEDRINVRGSSDERALLRLAKSQQQLTPLDLGLIYACLASPGGKMALGKAPGKGFGMRRDFLGDFASSDTFRRFNYVDPFRRLLDGGFKAETWRSDLAKALTDVYLLSPPAKPLGDEELRRKLNLKSDPPKFQPPYLLQQLALLKDYSEKNAKPPLKDLARVRTLLGKSP